MKSQKAKEFIERNKNSDYMRVFEAKIMAQEAVELAEQEMIENIYIKLSEICRYKDNKCGFIDDNNNHSCKNCGIAGLLIDNI